MEDKDDILKMIKKTDDIYNIDELYEGKDEPKKEKKGIEVEEIALADGTTMYKFTNYNVDYDPENSDWIRILRERQNGK